MPTPTRAEFLSQAAALRAAHPGDAVIVPVCVRLLADQLTPVVAYRRLVAPDEREAPSFLLESVEGGDRQGRYSVLGAQPAIEVVAKGEVSEVVAHGSRCEWLAARAREARDPLAALRAFTHGLHLGALADGTPGLPGCFLGGLVGYAAYDSVRYAEPGKLGFASAPPDDRALPDLHFGFYDNVVVFDHAAKVVVLVHLAAISPKGDPEAAYETAVRLLAERGAALEKHSEPLRSGEMPGEVGAIEPTSNMRRDDHAAMLAKAKEYIRAGDIFQVVLGQRFERASMADPFDVYRALRTVNPSPYMAYIQASGCILVASSPEILCRVRKDASGAMVVTNRPLAGTRRRGRTSEEDLALERELLADAKERAEHVMLVDLGRNDVGRVASPGSIVLPGVMEIERYSHVMHISSTVTGRLRDGLDCWDALRAALPVGTISGAPKIRAMQIIDELEPVRRGPYGGGLGYVGVDGQMDIALALRTIVVPLKDRPDGGWKYHMQASGGIVADSVAADEYMETVNKAAAMNRALAVAELAFGSKPGGAATRS